ncbi:MAG: threonine ammonia-lyase [Pseudomonadales bacterium]|jgi:threonine dehydratase|nr:threonine ammonia-lyase [Pseudomonadales bacterium]
MALYSRAVVTGGRELAAELAISLADVESARRLIEGQVLRTPVQHSETLSRITGAEIWLKFENQQFTASFKERGALTRLLALDSAERQRGVICMSAGNHAQAVAHHAKRLGIPATIVMPRYTPNAKVEATRVFGPELILHGAVFDEAIRFTEDLARERGLTLVHPYDDPAVMAGQGTLALEALEDAPRPDVVVVPIGGGGLVSGIATVFAARAPEVEVLGVEADRFAGAYRALRGEGPAFGVSTIAEGIAVKAPGSLTLPIIRALVKDVLLVTESHLERAVLSLLEIEKTVVEGAGAAGLAAVLAEPERFRDRRVLLPLCGGNIDLMILSSVIQRGLARSGRLVRIAVEIPDVPGALGEICRLIGELDSNIVDLSHQRAFSGSSVRATEVTFLLQMRGAEQIDTVLARLGEEGYEARSLG